MLQTNDFLVGKKILIVEDDEVIIEKYKKIFPDGLVKKNYYDEALGELTSGKYYDLIIFDIMLPISEDDFHEIKKLRKELNKLIETIMNKEDEKSNSGDLKNELEQIRKRRSFIKISIVLFSLKFVQSPSKPLLLVYII